MIDDDDSKTTAYLVVLIIFAVIYVIMMVFIIYVGIKVFKIIRFRNPKLLSMIILLNLSYLCNLGILIFNISNLILKKEQKDLNQDVIVFTDCL